MAGDGIEGHRHAVRTVTLMLRAGTTDGRSQGLDIEGFLTQVKLGPRPLSKQ
jgi:hypothetical protein